MGDPVFVTPTSPSPRRDTERTPARRRAASAQCSRMLHLLIASAEAVRIRHEENERLLRATETRPFNAALPEPVISALDNLPAPAADDAAALAALAVETTSAAPVVPGPPCDPSVVPLPHDSDTEAEIMDTTASRKRQRPSESSDDEGAWMRLVSSWCSRKPKGDGSAKEPQLLLHPEATQARRPLRLPHRRPRLLHPPCRLLQLRPTGPGAVFPRNARLSLAKALSALAGVRDVRVNTKKNIVAADAATAEWRERLLGITELAGIPVGARLPADRTRSSGILQGILGDHSEEELLAGLESEVPVLAARRQGTALILDFAASAPPTRVRLFRMAHQVRACRPRPLQCQRCGSYGHATATCSRPQRCLRCGSGPHGDVPCAVKARCIHCGQAHAATSPNCQLWQRERHLATIKATAPTFIPHREAMGALSQPPATPPVPPPAGRPGGLSYAQAARPVQKGAPKPPTRQRAPPQQPGD
ncbi:hypothetical protein HPB50_029488 [Hyalomma asiaticum]|nr:hypothetical protein HPB50_029488 [Hyalomma asiaticum]